ncbi:MAG: membrane lipoprotein lipid attachment site-containing protein [Clostridia bacterium]|nr:membrane lipoprotein lipid attachment site-containing protein [Clostridia bacterium]
MKKIISLLLVAIVAVAMLAGCSGGAKPTDPADVKGETFDGGNVSALVPEGWMAFHGTDYFNDYEEGYDPSVINIVKDAKSELDMFTNPYVMINYYGPDSYFMSSRDLYDDAKDIEPMEIGSYSWSGYAHEGYGYPTAVLEATDGTISIQVTVILENGNKKISLDDAEVQAIIASITPAQ